MTKISRQEALKIALASNIHVHEHEIDPLIRQLQDVLSYAERVQEVTGGSQEVFAQNVNVFREDMVVPCDAAVILARAPQAQSEYFVVPAILHSN
jgi:aspartyl/glutamyl-tRNA(Asn/Gln) amidotransferase C subunit